MKHFMKIKCIKVFDRKDRQIVVISLRNGYDVIREDNGSYVNQQNGECYEPLYDEFTDELVGFIG